MKVTGDEVWASTPDVEETRRIDLGLLQQWNGQYGAAHCHVGAKHVYSDVHVLDMIAGRRWFFRRSPYVALVTVFHLGM